MLFDFISSTTILVFAVVLLTLWFLTRRPSGLPPGPPLLPFIGNLLSMGPNPVVAYKDLRKKYGDIFCVYACSTPLVVISGYKVLREALLKNPEVFSDRPHSIFTDLFSQNKGIMSTSGKMHDEQRQFALNTLRQFGMGKQILEKKINEEILVFLEELRKGDEKPQNPNSLINKSISNIICSIVFGQRFDYDDDQFSRYLALTNENIESLSVVSLVFILPFLRHLPGDLFRLNKCVENNRAIEIELFMPMIKRHVDKCEENDSEDFITAYVKEMKRREEMGEDTTMKNETLLKVLGDLFVAGSETTSTAIRWTLAFFLNYPDVQTRCFREIQENIGQERQPSLKDKPKLPYLEATIMEVLRRADVAPHAAPHATSRDAEFLGYKLPKGISVMVDLDSVLQDPEIWGDPENFRPDRFLDGDGKVFKPEEFIPFSLGRRMCLGESLARMELFLYLASMIQRFEFVNPNQEKPSLEGIVGLTHFPKPFEVIAKVRTR